MEPLSFVLFVPVYEIAHGDVKIVYIQDDSAISS